MQLLIVVLVCLFVWPAYADDNLPAKGNATRLTDQFIDPGGFISGDTQSDRLGFVDGSHMSLDTADPTQLDTLYSGLLGTLVSDRTSAVVKETDPAPIANAAQSPASSSIERGSVVWLSIENAAWMLVAVVCAAMLIALLRIHMKGRLD